MEEAMLDMSSKLGIRIVYTGVVANSLPAHRLIQHLQQKREIDEEEYSYDKIEKFMDHLYQSYFTHSQHPSSVKTLASCIKEAGLPMSRDQVAAFLASDKLARETKAMVAEQEVNDVTGVPDVRIDGRRRDITLVGAKFVEEYAAALRQIIKEFN
jgi:predicted DsbA family dithiol-disulfide isomerase